MQSYSLCVDPNSFIKQGGDPTIYPMPEAHHVTAIQHGLQKSVTWYVNTLYKFQFSFAMIGIILMVAQLEVWYLNTAGTFPLCKEGIDPEWCDPRSQAKVFPLTKELCS